MTSAILPRTRTVWSVALYDAAADAWQDQLYAGSMREALDLVDSLTLLRRLQGAKVARVGNTWTWLATTTRPAGGIRISREEAPE